MTSRPVSEGRLIAYRARGPAENMAIDQTLLESIGQTEPPTLRLYGWSVPTLSLGYFQTLHDRRGHAASEPLPVVRRATGGGAIIHDQELTYSFTLPLAASAPGIQRTLYTSVHEAMRAALGEFGVRADRFAEIGGAALYEEPFLCFMSRTADDLIVGGYKVLGSAQRKSRWGLLQHGSLLLKASPFAPELPGVGDLTGRSISIDQIAAAFGASLAAAFSLRWNVDGLSPAAEERVAQVIRQRYDSPAWTGRR